MATKRLITSYERLNKDVMDALNNKYPDGYENHIIKVDKGNGDFFYGVTVDWGDTSYLVKINVAIDSNLDDIDEDIDNNDEDNDNMLTGLEDEPSTEDEDVIG